MADNLNVTPGTGAIAAADDVGGVLYQRIKLTMGADGANDGDVADATPLPVKTPSIAQLTATPTVTAGAYTTGQVVGGLITLTNAVRVSGGSGLISAVNVCIKTNLTAPYDVLFFHTNPTNSTFTDNASLSVNVADLPFLIGVAHCTDLSNLGTPNTLMANNALPAFKNGSSNRSLYAVIVMRGAQMLASTTAIVLNVSVIPQD